jgi:hypothetical protein
MTEDEAKQRCLDMADPIRGLMLWRTKHPIRGENAELTPHR